MAEQKEESAVQKFLGEVGIEGEKSAFQNTQEDPFNKEVPEVKVEEKEEVKETKPLPFNKDPKIQKFIEKEISKRLENFKSEAPQTRTEEDNFKDVMESFTTVIGNDTPDKVKAFNALKNSLVSIDKKASQKSIEQLEA